MKSLFFLLLLLIILPFSCLAEPASKQVPVSRLPCQEVGRYQIIHASYDEGGGLQPLIIKIDTATGKTWIYTAARGKIAKTNKRFQSRAWNDLEQYYEWEENERGETVPGSMKIR